MLVRRVQSDWDNFYKPFLSMQREIDNLFSNFLSGERGASIDRSGWRVPSVDVYDTEKEFVFEFELPGFDKEDVKVNVQNDVLTVECEKKLQRDSKEKNYHLTERQGLCFKRQFNLPDTAESDKTFAQFEKGVLEIRMPKKEVAQPKSIDIQVK